MSTPKLAMFTLKVPLSRTILLSPDKVNKGFLHSNFWLSIDKNINTEKERDKKFFYKQIIQLKLLEAKIQMRRIQTINHLLSQVYLKIIFGKYLNAYNLETKLQLPL